MIISIALKNIRRHLLNSVILLVIFSICSFTLAWALGFTNKTVVLIKEATRDSYGDITFSTDFFQTQTLDSLELTTDVSALVHEREIRVIVEGNSKSTNVTLIELSEENTRRLSRYIRPVQGRLPKTDGEIVITDFIQHGLFNVGDRIMIEAASPSGKIVRKLFTVCGITKSSAFKAIGFGYLVTSGGMDRLLESADHANLVCIFVEDQKMKAEGLLDVRTKMRAQLEGKGITIRGSWTVTEREEKFSIFSSAFIGVKYIILFIAFPLTGAVIAAIVWLSAFQRRREMWTYLCLGCTDAYVTIMVMAEHIFTALAGITFGLVLFAVTSAIVEANNIWLVFSYTVSMMVSTVLYPQDYCTIYLYLCISAIIWMIAPIKKITSSRAFSF